MIPIETTTLFSEIRDWLEVIYFISGFVVMVLAALGLWQLKLAKDQMKLSKDQLETSKNIFKTQSKRSAVEAAVVECRKFSETVVQDSIALDKFCKDNSITLFYDVELIKMIKDLLSIQKKQRKKTLRKWQMLRI